MQGIPYSSAARLREQTLALIGLRWTVWRRRLSSDGKWGRIFFTVAALLGGLGLTGGYVFFMLLLGRELKEAPDKLAEWGGATGLFGLMLAAMLGLRLYFSIISVATGAPFLQPRRFLVYAVPPALITSINCLAQLFEPAWLIFYAPAVVLAWVTSRLPGGAPLAASCLSLALVFLCSAAILQALIALFAELFAHKKWRRVVVLALMCSGWGIALASSRLSQAQSSLSLERLWAMARALPPGWAALLAEALARHAWLGAAQYALLLVGTGLLAAMLGHKLALREARRAPETVVASGAKRGGPAGWHIPLVPEAVAALIEKEVKTIFRAMWLQMIAGPVGFLVMRFLLMQGHTAHGNHPALRAGAMGPFLGPQPLLMGAFYAHLGVLAWSVNAFGVDGAATRGLFLWPVRGRTVLAAKNAVAYAVSLLIFVLLIGLSALVAPLTAGQVIVGLCAHAATFPVLAAAGNATSIYFPSPMRGGRIQRQPGGATAFVRVAALCLMALTAWAPYALAGVLGLPLVAAYLGELVAMAVVYGGLLSVSEQLLESKREPLLHALAKEE